MILKNYYIILAHYLTAQATNTEYITNFGGTQTAITTTSSSDNPYFNAAIFTSHQRFSASDYASSNIGAGVIFGDGDKTPTADDYKMAGNHLTTYSYSGNSIYGVDENGVYRGYRYTITNTGNADFTIKEVGLSKNVGTKAVLVERTVLDEPITIPAGGIGQVTYTIRFNYPT